jgi:hypothetical protein
MNRNLTPEELTRALPLVLGWIRATLAANAGKMRSVSSAGFARLPLYFQQKTLSAAKFVTTDCVPIPPMSAMGLNQFAAFEHGEFDGITYLDTFFLREHRIDDEGLHFHELIHVVQWRVLGPERFLTSYALGLEAFGYRNNPLEVIAYDAESDFRNSPTPFDSEVRVENELQRKLRSLFP